MINPPLLTADVITNCRAIEFLWVVITSALSRGELIMKLMKHVLQSLSLHQPLPSPEGGPRAAAEAERTL